MTPTEKNGITDEERAWAQRVLDDGQDTNVHLLSYCRFLTSPAPGAYPVRNAGGGITGYGSQTLDSEIVRLSALEAQHATAADAATEPEMRGAHEAVAQNYRLARMVRETDAAYAAQTFELAAVGWENLMPDALRAVYTGKSSGMWPHQRAERDAAEADAAADRLLAVGRENLVKRQHREHVTRVATAATDAELTDKIKETKDSDTPAFLILIRERDARSKRLRAARNKSQKAPASEAPFTADEEQLLTNTAAQTAGMDADRLAKFLAKPVVSRGDQLKHEAVVRELALRKDTP